MPNVTVPKSMNVPIKGKLRQNHGGLTISEFDYFKISFISVWEFFCILLENVFQLVNSSKIRPDIETNNVEMSTLRILPFESESATGFNQNIGSTYYFSFQNKGNTFFDKLCPYLDHCEGNCCLGLSHGIPQKNAAKLSNKEGGSFNVNESEDSFRVSIRPDSLI